MQILIDFFDLKDLMPHGYCLSWSSLLLWLHVISDLLIALSYYSIPLSLIYFVRLRKDLPYPWLIAMFALFIVACGTTHIISIVTIWLPLYWLEGYVKVFTVLISVATALAMFRVIPLALKLPSPAQLQTEIEHGKIADKARQEALERLQKIASRLPGMVYQFRLFADGNSSIPYCSDGIHDIFRLSPEQVLEDSSPLFALIHPNDYEYVIHSLKQSAQHLTTWFCEFRACFEEGSERWLLANGMPQREENNATLWHGFITDISERKSVENEILATRNQLQATLDAIPDLLFEVDGEGRYYSYHAPHSQSLLTSHESFLGKKLTEILPADAAYICLAALQEARQQGWSIGKRLKLTRPQGDFWFELSVSVKHTESTQEPHFIVLSRDITERKRMEEALRASEEQFRNLFTQAPLGIALIDSLTGRIYNANQKYADIVGLTVDEVQRMNWMDITHPDDIQADLDNITLMNAGKIDGFSMEKRYIRPDGSIVWINLTVARMWLHNEDNSCHHCIVEDISKRKQAETELHIAAIAFESQEAMVITDANSIILRINAAFTETTGYTAEDVIGRKMNLLKSGRHDDAFYQAMWESINNTGAWQGEIWDRRKNGECYPKWLTITAVIGSDGNVSHYVGTHMDITDRKATEEHINRLAFYDPLTQLPNRRLLQEQLKHGIGINRRTAGQMAVLMMDLDKFKAVNDTLGHTAGDELLQQVAVRIKAHLRETDMVARLGGDEFVILIEDVGHYEHIARIADAIIHALSQPFTLCQSYEVVIGTSIGIAIHPQHGDSVETLIDHADTALYHAKDQGRGCFAYFSEELTHKAHERMALEVRLRRAIDQQELRVYFQPQIDINSGQIVGAEALLRWHDPIHGCLTPYHFIALAEETGLIIPIGAWVLRETCRLGQQWLQQGLPPITLAVNVSPYQFNRCDMNTLVTEVLTETGFPADYLELEITESGLMDNQQHAMSILNNLHKQGVHLAIDDFGTGYSSLAYLKYFPVDVLKIDKTFIDDIPFLHGDMAITATIIAMAHHLGFKVLAEGVETEEQLAFLREQGCDSYQGYLYSKPIPADDFANLLAKSQRSITLATLNLD
jgi:diguanylate cyclase (GGDEF)-like protein/PAS domain S-box-containing protein